VRFGKGEIVKSVLGVEYFFHQKLRVEWGGARGKRKDVKSSVSDKTVVGGGGDGETTIEEG
jgi:hypothetical protein